MNDQYSELYSSYQWLVPSTFNIAEACVHRWAENPHEGRRIALYCEDEFGQRTVWTYTRLSEVSRQLANGLVKMGVAQGDRVALVMARRPEMVAAYMAIFSVGAIAVPLSAQLETSVLSVCLRDAQARVAVVDAVTGPGLLKAKAQFPALTQIIGLGFQHDWVIPWRTLLARQPVIFKVPQTRASSPALLLYRSQGNGALKGVLLPHCALIGNLPGFVASQNWFPNRRDIFWSPADWARSGGLLNALLPTLYFGHGIVGVAGQFSAPKAFKIMERYQVTNTFLSPEALTTMMMEISSPREHYQLALRAIMTTGEPLERTVFDWCKDTLAVTPNETFGQTEMNCVAGNSHQKWPTKPGSMGRPYPGHRLAVLDSSGQPCPAGVVGNIALNKYDIYGHPEPVLFLGYWRNAPATEAKFMGDWCLTGDLASADVHGNFWYAGHDDIQGQQEETRHTPPCTHSLPGVTISGSSIPDSDTHGNLSI
ncbi:MAG: AMP-binding protein [Burkholderiaceae bacterium]